MKNDKWWTRLGIAWIIFIVLANLAWMAFVVYVILRVLDIWASK
jgi:hypothetical protein